MGYSALFDAPYYTGQSVSSAVPGFLPVALGGRAYLVDLKSELFKRQTLARLRPQSDMSEQVGEQSINTEDLWRRSQSDWSHGAGQTYYDRAGSDQARFNTSKGIDPWTKWQVSLLRDTAQKKASVNTNLFLIVAGGRVYLTDGQATSYTTTVTSADDFAAVTGGPAATALGIASDGFRVYVAYGASGLYVTNTGSGAFTGGETVTGTVNVVGYVKGRLMAAAGGTLYNITTLGAALPAALYTHPNSSFTWVGFTEGSSFIYAGGYAGDKSLIYRTAIRPDGTALDIPVVAGELPDGEIIRSLQGYLGFMVLGTDKGVRFAAVDGNGNLTIGKLIETNSSVRCFEPQDRFVWFGWTNYDGTSTGLGRLDLSVFVDPFTPAHASDLMATGQGTVNSVVTFGTNYDIRLFSVSGIGVYVEITDLVESGTLRWGQITYGIPDKKTAMYYHLRTEPLAGTVDVTFSTDGGSFGAIGSMTTTGDSSLNIQTGQQTGERFEIQETFNRDGDDETLGPVMTRHTLRAYPSPSRGTDFIVPLILHEEMRWKGQEYSLDPQAELSALQAMIDSHQPENYQEGSETFTVFVEGIEWRPHHLTRDGTFFNGLAVVQLKAVATEV